MFFNFNSVFNPTAEQKIKQLELAIDSVRYCIQKQDCICCKYSTVVESAFPSAPPEIFCAIGLWQERSENHCEGFCVSSMKMNAISDLEKKIIELKKGE